MVGHEKPRIVYWLDNNLYLNITNKCSNNCWFCFRNFKQGVGGFNLKLKAEPTTNQIITELEEALAARRWGEVVFCGFGEPTERLDVLLAVARWIRQRCGSSLSVRLDTNGHGYELNKGRDVVEELKAAGVFKVSVEVIDPVAWRQSLSNKHAGACATFEGWVRDQNEGRRVKSLDYEAHVALAEAEGTRILADAEKRFKLVGSAAIHRIGHLSLGDLAVWVGVTAKHRAAAFDACRFIIDEMKLHLPIWKKEDYWEGQAKWINAEVEEEKRAER